MPNIEHRKLTYLESRFLHKELSTYEKAPSTYIFPVEGEDYLVSLKEDELFADAIAMQKLLEILANLDFNTDVDLSLLEQKNFESSRTKFQILQTKGLGIPELLNIMHTGDVQKLLNVPKIGVKTVDLLVLTFYLIGFKPQDFHPIFDQVLVELVAENELKEKGMPSERITVAKSKLTQE